MAGTFGQQIEQQKQVEQSRPTRTQRLIIADKQTRFNSLKTEAERIRDQDFVDKNVEVEYFVPQSYVRRGRINPNWFKLSESERQKILARTRQRDKVRFTENKVDEFTMEDYQSAYDKMNPELQQFFTSPQDMLNQRIQKIAQQKQQADSTISQWQSQLNNKIAKLEEYKQRWREKSREYKDKHSDDYDERVARYENEIDEYRNRIANLRQEYGQLDKGVEFNSLVDFAEEKARASRNREEQSAKLIKQLESNPDLAPIKNGQRVVGVWDTKKNPLPDWFNGKELTTSNIGYYNNITNWMKKEGYNKLPQFAKEILNPKAYEFQKQNPDEKLWFNDKGEVTYVNSKKYGYFVPATEYPTKDITDWEKKNIGEDILVNAEGQAFGVTSTRFGNRTVTIDEYNKLIEEENQKNKERQLQEWKALDSSKPQYNDDVLKGGTDEEKKKEIAKALEGVPMTPEMYYAIGDPESFQKGMDNIDKVITGAEKIYKNIPDANLYLNLNTMGVSTLNVISPIKMGQGSINLKEQKKEWDESLGKTQEKLIEDEMKRTGLKKELDEKFQEEYQTRFERKYMEKIINNEINFADAKKEWESSEDVKNISKKYQIAIDEGRANKWSWEGAGVGGLSLVRGGLSLVPTTLKSTVVTAGAVYGGYKILSVTPKIVLNLATAGIGAKGVYDAFFNPKALPETKALGVLNATISVGTLGYQAYRWWRTPTVKTENIVIEKSRKFDGTWREKALVTKDGKYIDLEGNTIQKYTGQKLSENVQMGRRTIVSTKGRNLLGLKPIYEGIPTQQLGKTYVIDSFRGEYVFKTKSGYQKAYDLLTERAGYTPYQARATLRYYAPIDEYELIKNAKFVVKTTPTGQQSIYIKETKDIERDVRMINEELGIKTKGGQKIREYIKGTSKPIGQIGEGTLYDTTFEVEKRFLTKDGLEFQRISQAGKTTKVFRQLTLATEKGTDVFRIANQKGILVGVKEFPVTLYTEKNVAKQILPKSSKAFAGKGETIMFDNMQHEVDLRKMYGIRIEKDNALAMGETKKAIVDMKKLKDPKYLKSLTKTLRDIYGSGLEKGGGAQSLQTKDTLRKITSKELKSALTPISKARVMTKIFEIGSESSIVAEIGATTSILSQRKVSVEKGAQSVKFRLSQIPTDAQLSALGMKLKDAQTPTEAQNTALGQTGGTAQIMPNAPILDIPIPPAPKIKLPKPARAKVFGVPNDAQLLKQLIKQRSVKQRSAVGLLPDFTSRALGLKPQEFSLKDSLKAMKKIQTGFEIRTGGKIKEFNERKLLKNIAK